MEISFQSYMLGFIIETVSQMLSPFYVWPFLNGDGDLIEIVLQSHKLEFVIETISRG